MLNTRFNIITAQQELVRRAHHLAEIPANLGKRKSEYRTPAKRKAEEESDIPSGEEAGTGTALAAFAAR